MPNYDQIGEKIKRAREEAGLSQRKLAELLGLSQPAINHYEHGDREVGIEMLSRIAKVTGKPLSYFLGENYAKLSPEEEERIIQEKMARMLGLKRIPVIGKVAAGKPILAIENIIDWIPVPEVGPIHADFALLVSGDSMVDADIENGDYVLIRRQDFITMNGQTVVCLLNGEEVTLKELWKDENEGWWLKPRNDKYDPIPINPNDVRVLGVYAGLLKPPRKK